MNAFWILLYAVFQPFISINQFYLKRGVEEYLKKYLARVTESTFASKY